MAIQSFDYIVVGSGCSGAMVAQTLVDGGKQVAMLDVGESDTTYKTLIPNKDYLQLRLNDAEQYKYFLGENAQGVVIDDKGKGAQITPPRAFMLRNTEKYIPLKSSTFTPIESLGYGGLGIGWGLQCWEFTKNEIKAAGMDYRRIIPAYEVVSKRIGISGTRDTAAEFTLGQLQSYDKSPTMDRNMQRVYNNYISKKSYFDKQRIFMGRTPLALITKDRGPRKKYPYRDMDFYDDNSGSAWRPWLTVDKLRTQANFTYINNFLALRFDEQKTYTTIYGIDPTLKKQLAYRCKWLILAAGALGTARIALRSYGKPAERLPLLCNPYTYVPSVQPSMFGSGAERSKIGFGQLSAFIGKATTEIDDSILTLYSYQSLMLFRIIRQAPLNFKDARPLLQYISSGLIVTGIQHSDAPSANKYLQLALNAASLTGDELQASYMLSEAELQAQKIRETQYIRAMRRTGLYAIKKINPGHGSSVHYAGTLPFSVTEKPLALDPSGRLHGTKRVYVADSSGFNFLPARGLTFTLLANAHVTTQNVLSNGT